MTTCARCREPIGENDGAYIHRQTGEWYHVVCGDPFGIKKLNAEAQQTMNHLRDVLYILADLHPDDSCEAVKKALEFYNRKHPNQHIEPRRRSRPTTPTHAYQSDVPALKVRSIGETGKLTVEDNSIGNPVARRQGSKC
jgi:hypothetical protein